MTALLVMVGAAVGAPSRWLLDQYVRGRVGGVFPWGTFAINVSGSGVLGFLLGASAGAHDTALVALVGTGFCGGFTTFSSFGFETVRLAEEGEYAAACVNVAASVLLGVGAAFAGWWLRQLV
jgi:fluoride exporter